MRQQRQFTPKDLISKVFVKNEMYTSDEKVLRFIQNRSGRAKVAVASAVHKIEEQVFHGPLSKHFVKGMSQDQIHTKLTPMESYKYFFETDYTSFESGFSAKYTEVVEEQMFNFF